MAAYPTFAAGTGYALGPNGFFASSGAGAEEAANGLTTTSGTTVTPIITSSSSAAWAAKAISLKALGAVTTVVDGVTVPAGAEILCTNQSNAAQDGPQVLGSGGSYSRPADYTSGQTIQPGTFVECYGGNTYANTFWGLAGTSAATVDTTATSWTQMGGSGSSATRIAYDEFVSSGSTSLTLTHTPLVVFGATYAGGNLYSSDYSVSGTTVTYSFTPISGKHESFSYTY